MDTSVQPIKDWQGWLARFRDIYSTQGLLGLIDIADDDDDENQDWSWMTTFMIPVQAYLCSAMLMASLQTPADQLEKTLASIVTIVTKSRFDKAPRGLNRIQKDMIQKVARESARIMPPMSETFAAILKCYVNDTYDASADVNQQMREAMSLLSSRNRAVSLEVLSRAGAAVLRGARVWDGWLSEGSGEFEIWALSIITLRNALGKVLPLEKYEVQRLRTDEVTAKLSRFFAQMEKADAMVEEIAEDSGSLLNGDTASTLDEIGKLCGREEPLTDDEIKEMGDRYEAYGEMATRSITALLSTVEDNEEAANVMRVFVTLLGILRYPERLATMQLTMLVTSVSDRVDPDTIDEAEIALKRIGPPALPDVFDFVRYTSREDERSDMLQVLGVVGRGSEEVFNYLAHEFAEASWLDDKIDYVLPLALTHDPRAIGLLAEALRDPAIDENDAWELLDGLQELEVTFYVNHDNRSVNLPGYGIIEDVLPKDWRSRKELEEEDEEDWDEVWEDPDDFGGEEDEDESEDDFEEVVYDKDGTPRCPDCGAEMHYIDGVWVHEQDVEKPKSAQPKIKAVGRNDPCPCGSGKKYKYCHGRNLDE